MSSRPRPAPRRALAALPLSAAVVIVLGAHGAFGQTASPEDVAAARSLGTEGTRLADAGDCGGAIPKLEAAEKLFHAPTTLDRLGECQISVGRIVAGTENLRRVVREPLAANAPPVFVAAKKRAQQALSAAESRIGDLRIHVDGPAPDKVSVTVDGTPVSTALLDADRPTDPGPHAVSATAPGYRAATENVTIGEGGHSAVSLRLDVDPSAAPGTAVVGGQPPRQDVAPAESTTAVGLSSSTAARSPNRAPAIAAFAVGGVGLVVGTVFGALALGTKSTLDGECAGKTCPTKAQSDIDSLGSKATISTIAFGVGLVGIAVGTVMLVTSHGSDAPRTAGVVGRPRPHSLARLAWLGLGQAGVGGTFE